MKCLNREELEKLMAGEPITDSTPDSSNRMQYYFCCIAKKGVIQQISPYIVVRCESPHDAIPYLHAFFPNHPRIDGQSTYIDYVTVNEAFAKYVAEHLELPNNLKNELESL